ncbi:hypothetical protein PSTT_10980 [Puccinia striiformis]|uniref:ATPase AAA-type core domain-containing protein n=1 Tax=Puccinia striiformis TaxID=27350 RepID=A0A2S4V243_9BASI|nr:hypothetical protein PSTT_10980 [Puccinia striiformis]
MILMKINITFSGLLNVIDGVTPTTSQRLIFMTTNHLEKLDRALIPPGRIDLSLQIGNATLHQTLELFQKFYEDPKLIIEMEFTGLLNDLIENNEGTCCFDLLFVMTVLGEDDGSGVWILGSSGLLKDCDIVDMVQGYLIDLQAGSFSGISGFK